MRETQTFRITLTGKDYFDRIILTEKFILEKKSYNILRNAHLTKNKEGLIHKNNHVLSPLKRQFD